LILVPVDSPALFINQTKKVKKGFGKQFDYSLLNQLEELKVGI